MSPAFDRPWRHVPNGITVVRGLLIPVIGWLLAEERYESAFWTVVVSALSDLVDGQLARRFNAHSRFGAIADPVADKLTMLTVVIGLMWQGLLPLWLAVALVARDVVIVAGAAAYHRFIEPVEMAPTWLSKLNTALEFARACRRAGRCGTAFRSGCVAADGVRARLLHGHRVGCAVRLDLGAPRVVAPARPALQRGLARGGQVGVGNGADLLVDQRPKWVAAQARQRTERDRDGAAFSAQQPGPDARNAAAPAAAPEAVDRIIRRKRQCHVAERDEIRRPGRCGGLFGHGSPG